MNRQFLESLVVLSFGLLVIANPVLRQAHETYLSVSLQGISINLPVDPLKQSKTTSCGEAVIAMAYDFAYPENALNERAILSYAEMKGYYTETKAPFTSPANMVKITQHYTKNFSTGTVRNSAKGLALLKEKLQKGNPVIIDVTARLDDPTSGAHFIIVTGISVASDNKFAVMIYYIDPLTGKKRSSPWFGNEGIWNAWLHNNDPGGSGWWLSIQPPADLAPINGTGSMIHH